MATRKKGAARKKPAPTSDDTRTDPFMDELEGNFPDAFRFENEGDSLVGVVKGWSRAFSEYGPHPVVRVQRESDGETFSVHCLHTTLRNQMTEADPRVGDRIGIVFRGMVVGKSGRRKPYRDFRVRIDQGASPARSFTEAMSDLTQPQADGDNGEGGDDLPF